MFYHFFEFVWCLFYPVECGRMFVLCLWKNLLLITYHVTRSSCSCLGVFQVFYLPLNIILFQFYWVNLLVALLCKIWEWGVCKRFFYLQLSLRCVIWNSFSFIFFHLFGIILCSLLCFLFFLYIYIYICIYIVFWWMFNTWNTV